MIKYKFLVVYKAPEYIKWAGKWLSGEDRSLESAARAKKSARTACAIWAAWAAWAAGMVGVKCTARAAMAAWETTMTNEKIDFNKIFIDCGIKSCPYCYDNI